MHSAIPIALPFFLSAGVGLIVDGVRSAATGMLRAQLDTAFNVCLTIFSVLVFLFWLILLFGRPKFLIPRHMRYYHGIIGDLITTLVRKVFHRS